jgi:hypothetical protein
MHGTITVPSADMSRQKRKCFVRCAAQEWTVNDMRLGDLDALTDVIERTDWYHLSEIGTMVHGAVSGDNAWYREGDIFKAIEEAPTIDAVAVVRCKDCENWRKHTSELFGRDYGYCRVCMMDTKTDHFCSYGERKDGDG